ncbi:hypothetical protein L6164_023809 [Bauhinia variegata]|uniref:Uncharacterized protein n=1 Tax=Bauhinia variegata TaxID=167791 RepID=A0ACB9MN11_BAUVA|nr:hypothetical protein L6164_023809 [Bauhinia variegata]
MVNNVFCYSNYSLITFIAPIQIVSTVILYSAGASHSRKDEPDPEKRGTATLVHRRMFQAFTICNTIAMYSSILSSFVFLCAQLGDLHLAVNAYKLALTLVGVALATMSVAFMAAVDLVVGNLRWLGYIVMIIATFFLITFFLLYTLYTYPYRASLPISGGHTAAWLEDGQYNSEYYSDGES